MTFAARALAHARGGPGRPARAAAVTELLEFAAPFALSFALVSPFYFALRARLLTFIAAATIVAVAAYFLELAAENAAGDLAGPTIVLLLVAPVTEELLKLGVSVPTGATYESSAGAGAGFAATENGLYFLAAWSEPTTTLIVLVAVRALTDPLLHITTCTLTSSSWRGEPWALPAGILVHIGWNAMSLFVLEVNASDVHPDSLSEADPVRSPILIPLPTPLRLRAFLSLIRLPVRSPVPILIHFQILSSRPLLVGCFYLQVPLVLLDAGQSRGRSATLLVTPFREASLRSLQ